MSNHNERRGRPRYPLRAFAELGSSDKEWAAHVLDISHDGARAVMLDDCHFRAGDSIRLRLEIPEPHMPSDEPPYLYLYGTLVHQQAQMLGIQYEPATDQDAKLLCRLLDSLNTIA